MPGGLVRRHGREQGASERLAGPEVCIVSRELWAVSKLSKDPVCGGVSPSLSRWPVESGGRGGKRQKALGAGLSPGSRVHGVREGTSELWLLLIFSL